MKIFYAWLLLSISTVQWIGSHLCFEVSYLVKTERRMSEAEAAIAEELAAETGLDTKVKILDPDRLVPRGHVYGDFFAFSKNHGDTTVYYAMEKDTSSVSYDQVSSHTVPQQENPGKTALLKSLFQEFTLPSTALPSRSWEPSNKTENFRLIALQGAGGRPTPTPPPDFA